MEWESTTTEQHCIKILQRSPAEREAIKEFLDKGIDVKIQVIPADKVVEVKDIL